MTSWYPETQPSPSHPKTRPSQFALELVAWNSPMTESATRVRAERADRWPGSGMCCGDSQWTWPSGRSPVAAQQPTESFVDGSVGDFRRAVATLGVASRRALAWTDQDALRNGTR
jgi:hypothetical protein